jgi:hypothetical protein
VQTLFFLRFGQGDKSIFDPVRDTRCAMRR